MQGYDTRGLSIPMGAIMLNPSQELAKLVPPNMRKSIASSAPYVLNDSRPTPPVINVTAVKITERKAGTVTVEVSLQNTGGTETFADVVPMLLSNGKALNL